jgi:hypothetical protein
VLRDIHLPREPSWWPPAPGWWIVALLIVIAIVAAFWWWRRQRERHAIESALLAEVDVLVEQWREQPQQLASGLHQLLRRCALRYDASAARLHGAEWRRALAVVTPDTKTLDHLMLLESAMYRSDVSFDTSDVVAATRGWLLLAWRYRAKGRISSVAQASSPESSHA